LQTKQFITKAKQVKQFSKCSFFFNKKMSCPLLTPCSFQILTGTLDYIYTKTNYLIKKNTLYLSAMTFLHLVAPFLQILKINQRLSRACIVHLVIKKTNWSYVKTMSCSGSHLGITINIKNTKFVKDLPMIDAQ
jgi:hypothetical protein